MFSSGDKILNLKEQKGSVFSGMTRAKSQLLITSSETTSFTERMVQLVAP